MNSAEYVTNLITQRKAEGAPLSAIAWEAAKACVGWPYVFGARWQYCTPENRRARYSSDHPTIKTACKNFNGADMAGCAGCKWYPGHKYTRINDCRGFTYGVLKAVYEWELMGAGATSQWNTEKNWTAKGEISTMPADTLVCLFVKKGNTMEHTGFGLNNETVECSSGVQYFATRNKKWTHWGLPKCVDGTVPVRPDPEPAPVKKPTLRKGSRGDAVKELQQLLIGKGYSCGSKGTDGIFGEDTLYAVKKFQQACGLTMDGIVGPKTWAALEQPGPAPMTYYSVTVSHLSESQAKALAGMYDHATIEKEVGG